MKGLISHGILALVGLVLAYMTWTKKDEVERPKGDVEIFACDKDDLTAVELAQERKEVRAEPREENGEQYYWFKVTDKPAPAPGAKAPAAKPKTEQFVGNDAAKTFIDGLAPLRALRSIGQPQKDTLKDLELDKSKTVLTVHCGKRKGEFVIGGSTFGAGDRYIRSKSGGDVYLLSADTVRGLEGATFRFMQRSLQTTTLDNVEQIRIRDGAGKSKDLLHRNRQEPNKAEWVDAKEPAKRNELYGNWLSNVDQLRVESYLKPNEKPGADLKDATSSAAPVLSADYLDKGRSVGSLQLVKVTLPSGAHYYAKSGATRVWVKMVGSAAQRVEEELPAVLSGQEPKGVKPTSGPAGGARRPPANAPSEPPTPPKPPAPPHG